MRRPLFLTAIVFFFLVGVLALVRTPDHWPEPESPPRQGEALDIKSDHAAAHHSAEALGHLVREPQNTWSNVAFLFAGSLLIFRANNKTIIVAGFALIAVGIGSFLYHASASRTLRHLDVGAMYWLYVTALVLVAGIGSKPVHDASERHPSVIFIFTFVAGVLLAIGRNVRMGDLKPFSLTLITASTATALIATLAIKAFSKRCPQNRPLAAAAIVFFAAAVICQLGDRPGGWLCNPAAVIQPHALWHVFSATAFLLAMLALDTKRESNR